MGDHLVKLQVQGGRVAVLRVLQDEESIKSVITEIATFVFSMPKKAKLATTATAAMKNAQWEPVHFASQFDTDEKYVETLIHHSSDENQRPRTRGEAASPSELPSASLQNEVRDDRDHDQYQDQRSTGEQVVITRVALILARCQEHQERQYRHA